MLNEIIVDVEALKAQDGTKGDKAAYQEEIDWLKSLRPQNWTKEDKERYISCLQRLGTGNPEQPETINSKWFKEHVYPKPQWKPSDEQIKAVKEAACYSSVFSEKTIDNLIALSKQLKKLMEEKL
jgi:hypothetical protein